MTTRAAVETDVVLLKPTLADAAGLHGLVLDSEALEANTRYAYLLLASHFRDTCIVAHRGREMIGFVAGYRLPRRPSTLFVWQVGVAPSARRMGLAGRMLDALLNRRDCSDVTCVEATVAPSNHASARLFESLARRRDTTCTRLGGFIGRDFGDEEHEEEVLFRVGPWRNE